MAVARTMEKGVLLVDDEPGALLVLERTLRDDGYRLAKAQSGEEALDLFLKKPFPVVVTDINMPGMSGLELLDKLRETAPDTLVIMLTAYGDFESAVEALRAQAYDYLTKPFKPEEIQKCLERAFRKLAAAEPAPLARPPGQEPRGFESIVGTSEALRKAVRLAGKLALSDETLLITGASGTGKELFARAIHEASSRSAFRFVPINCSAFPDSLAEAELFGHIRGAFTGASNNRAGLIEVADRGTVLLDEVSELQPNVQVKLLRFLQDYRIRRLGSTSERPLDVRVIAATNKPLEDEVAGNRFRADLFFRLRVLELRLPSLSARPEDIPVYMCHFLEEFCGRNGREPLNVSQDAMGVLRGFSWPGNVRELENLARRLAVTCDGPTVEVEDLKPLYQASRERRWTPQYLNNGANYSDARSQVLEDFNQAIISEALDLEGWNISRAAARLGTAKSNVIRIMRRFNISREDVLN